jgi:hypothetical protein
MTHHEEEHEDVHEGSFGTGQEETEHHPEAGASGDFAEGQEHAEEHEHEGTFAAGQEETERHPEGREHGDFAEGQEKD